MEGVRDRGGRDGVIEGERGGGAREGWRERGGGMEGKKEGRRESLYSNLVVYISLKLLYMKVVQCKYKYKSN